MEFTKFAFQMNSPHFRTKSFTWIGMLADPNLWAFQHLELVPASPRWNEVLKQLPTDCGKDFYLIEFFKNYFNPIFQWDIDLLMKHKTISFDILIRK